MQNSDSLVVSFGSQMKPIMNAALFQLIYPVGQCYTQQILSQIRGQSFVRNSSVKEIFEMTKHMIQYKIVNFHKN